MIRCMLNEKTSKVSQGVDVGFDRLIFGIWSNKSRIYEPRAVRLGKPFPLKRRMEKKILNRKTEQKGWYTEQHTGKRMITPGSNLESLDS